MICDSVSFFQGRWRCRASASHFAALATHALSFCANPRWRISALYNRPITKHSHVCRCCRFQFNALAHVLFAKLLFSCISAGRPHMHLASLRVVFFGARFVSCPDFQAWLRISHNYVYRCCVLIQRHCAEIVIRFVAIVLFWSLELGNFECEWSRKTLLMRV